MKSKIKWLIFAIALLPILGVAMTLNASSFNDVQIVSSEEMSVVIGGTPCTSCQDYCPSSTDCPDSRCDASGDDGELCGAGAGTGSSWTCGSWGSSSDNCVLSTASATCNNTACYCDDSGSCGYESSDTDHPGKDSCSD